MKTRTHDYKVWGETEKLKSRKKIMYRYKEDCRCGRCSTWAEITEYNCGCVTVEVFDDSDSCDECTNFSGKREYCGRPGHPDNHN